MLTYSSSASINYHQLKDHDGVSGNNVKSLIYYERLDAILGTRAASTPPLVLESGMPRPAPIALDNSEQENGGCSVQQSLPAVPEEAVGPSSSVGGPPATCTTSSATTLSSNKCY